jgi:hypothetical protein
MKRILLTAVLTVITTCLVTSSAYSWIIVDTSSAPSIPLEGYFKTVHDIDNMLMKNFRNYAGAFPLANVGGYPIGDAYIGDFPHMYFGVSAAIGCANMKYYDEDIPREERVYPAYAPNPVLSLGFGLVKGFDLLFKVMILTDGIYRPPLNEKSAKLSKINFYSGGAKLRKNLIEEKKILPNLFGFGGLTISAGVDYMEGIIGINGQYNYTLNGVYLGPPVPTPGYYNIDFYAYYNFNLHWLMLTVNAQALAYVKFLWIFDLYAGFGAALTYGYTKLDGSGVGWISNPSLGDLGIIRAYASYNKRPRAFMGLFVAGLEINIWILKLNFETMVNISNGKDINLQLGTRFQF